MVVLMRNMSLMMVMMMMVMMVEMAGCKGFPEKAPIEDLLENVETIEVRADVGDSKIMCKDDKLDIAFIIDTSRSIHASEYDKQIKFVIELVSIFNISPQNTRVAAISFGQEVVRDTAFGFSRHETKEEVVAGIKGIVYRGRDLGDQTETGVAIAFTRKNVFRNTRLHVKRMCIVLTDGRSTDPLKTKQEASYAKKDGIKMIAVGIGNNVSMEELKAIASSGDLVFKIDSYEQLPQFERLIMTQICEDLYDVVNNTEIFIQDQGKGPTSTTPSSEVDTKVPIPGPVPMVYTTTPSPGVDLNANTATVTISVPSAVVSTTPSPGEDHPCKGERFDINIMFRPSRVPSRYVMQLIDKSIHAASMEKGLVRVGVITIPKSEFKGFRLNNYRSKGEIREHFKIYQDTFILTPSLLNLRARAFHKLNGGRPDARKIGILLIDAKVTDIDNAVEEVKFSQADGIELFIVSMGGKNADDAIAGLVDDKRTRIVHASLYSDLPYIANLLVRKICEW